MKHMRKVIAVLLAAVALTACKIDTTVDLQVNSDGSGVITLTAVADAGVVAQAPGLADDLRFDDATAAGWTVDGPTATGDGGLTLKVTHTFANVTEATALLRSINGPGGPLHDVVVTRSVAGNELTTAIAGTLRVDGGVDAFADPEVLAAVGGSPYADDIAATGLRPTDVLTFTFTADLPGVAATVGGGSTSEATGLSWSVPLDGTAADLATTSLLTQGGSSSTWSTVASVALVALIAWCLLAIAFIIAVVRARRAREQRRTATRH